MSFSAAMKSIFTEEEISEQFLISDSDARVKNNVRGPASQWTIKGDVLCSHYTSINGPFNARGHVRIGKYCAFGQYVSLISGGDHGIATPCQQIWLHNRFGFRPPIASKERPIEIGHNVWIGDKANILPGVSVGHGAVIAAGATVTSDVEPFAIYGGVPAKLIKFRFNPLIVEQLLQIRWWAWDEEKLARNKTFFETDMSGTEAIDLMRLIVE